MNKLKLGLLLFALWAGTAMAEPVAVIVNSANTQVVSQSDVKSIYSDKTIAWANGATISVHILPSSEPAAEVFAKKVLGMSAQDAASAEANRGVTNTSRNPQKSKRAALVSSIVAKSPEAIGYVPASEVEGKTGLRVLFTVE